MKNEHWDEINETQRSVSEPARVNLYGLSRKHIVRQNPTATLAALPSTLGDKLPKKYVSGGYVPRARDANSPAPINHVLVTRTGAYKTGDGETPVVVRPGADNHKKYKSLIGIGEAVYAHKGHK